MLPDHLKGLHLRSAGLITVEGRTINVWEFSPPTDPAILDSWALHFRRQYCTDQELPELLCGTGMTIEQYLNAHIFPDKVKAPGPSIRSGDFAEFLISDYLDSISWILLLPIEGMPFMPLKLKRLFQVVYMVASSKMLLTMVLTINT